MEEGARSGQAAAAAAQRQQTSGAEAATAAVEAGPSLLQVVERLDECRDDDDDLDEDFGFGFHNDGTSNDGQRQHQRQHQHQQHGTAAAAAGSGLDLHVLEMPTASAADELISKSHARLSVKTATGKQQQHLLAAFSNETAASVTNNTASVQVVPKVEPYSSSEGAADSTGSDLKAVPSSSMTANELISQSNSRFVSASIAGEGAGAGARPSDPKPEVALSSSPGNQKDDPRSPPPAAAMGWDDAPALAMATMPTTTTTDTSTMSATLPSGHTSTSGRPSTSSSQHHRHQNHHQLDILGVDGIEELASDMLDLESRNIAQNSSSSSSAGGAGGAGSSCGGGISVARSWHLGPGAKRGGAGGSNSSGSATNSTTSGNKGSGSDNACSGSTISGGRSSTIVMRRRTRGQSISNEGGGGGVSSIVDVVADGKGGSISGKKRRRSSGSATSDSIGGDNKIKVPKKKRATKKSNNNAIAKQAAENLKISHLVPERPSKGPNSYIRFCTANRQRVIDESDDPSMLTTVVGKILGKEWRAMSDKEQEPWTKAAAKAFTEYEVALQKYNTDFDAFIRTDVGMRWMEEQDRLRAVRPTNAEEKETRGEIEAAAAAKAEEERKIQEQIEEDKKLNLPPPPEKPKTPFVFFTECLKERLKSQNGGISPSIGIDEAIPLSIWTQMSGDEKAVYQRMANQARNAYKKEMEQYHQVVKAKRKRARDLADA